MPLIASFQASVDSSALISAARRASDGGAGPGVVLAEQRDADAVGVEPLGMAAHHVRLQVSGAALPHPAEPVDHHLVGDVAPAPTVGVVPVDRGQHPGHVARAIRVGVHRVVHHGEPQLGHDVRGRPAAGDVAAPATRCPLVASVQLRTGRLGAGGRPTTRRWHPMARTESQIGEVALRHLHLDVRRALVAHPQRLDAVATVAAAVGPLVGFAGDVGPVRPLVARRISEADLRGPIGRTGPREVDHLRPVGHVDIRRPRGVNRPWCRLGDAATGSSTAAARAGAPAPESGSTSRTRGPGVACGARPEGPQQRSSPPGR